MCNMNTEGRCMPRHAGRQDVNAVYTAADKT